jgi:hypothetical protein
MTSKINNCLLFLIFLAICSESRATVLYVRYSSSEIIIGADSKRTLGPGETACVCKISQFGDTFIAIAGLAEYGTFDPRNYAAEAITSSPTLVDARAKFEQLIERPLLDVLKSLKKNDAARYASFKQGAALNLIFVRFNDLPELAAIAFTPSDASDGSIVLNKNPITLTGNVKKSKRILVGFSKRAESLLDQPGLWSNGTVEGVQRALQISIADNAEAGEPIDLVQLTKGTVRWFPRQPECDSKSRRIGGQPPTCESSKHRASVAPACGGQPHNSLRALDLVHP